MRLPLSGKWRYAYAPAIAAAAVLGVDHHAARASLVAATVAGVAQFGGPRRWRRRWTYVTPTVRAVRVIAGTERVTLSINGEIKPRPSPAPSRAEAKVRAAYTHVEPVIRWLPDRAMRAQWAIRRPFEHWLRRPDQPRVKVTVHVDLLTTEQEQAIAHAIAKKIPIGDLRPSWNLIGRKATGAWHAMKRPPQHVGRAELDAHFDGLPDHEFFVGLDASSQKVIISLEDDSPHIACSAGSGAGKSVLAMLIAVQVLGRGGRVVILDRKGSHRWARGLPPEQVSYCLKPEQMHQALVDLGSDAWGRNDTAFYQPDGWTPADRVLVIAEELNATFSWLRRYWTELGEKGPSPAVIAFQDLLYTGRSAYHHVFAVAQMLTARTTGGGEARENFAVRALARYTANAWKMLCAGVPMPRRSRVRGRWQFVVGDEATEVQVAYLTPAEARAFARVTGAPRGLDSPMASGVAGNGPPTGNSSDPGAELLSIAEAIEEGTLPWSKGAVKMRLGRAREQGRPVPEPAGRRGMQTLLYTRDALTVWSQQELMRETTDAQEGT